MELVDSHLCVDRFEASTVEIVEGGNLRDFSPFNSVRGHKVKAVSRRGVIPQAYISRDEAEAACKLSSKRLCTDDEWLTACKGREPTLYPYGPVHKANYCVDTDRTAPLTRLFGGGSRMYAFATMNDPRLNQVEKTVAPTGSFPHCTNAFHVYDMVGNLHEWTADPAGTFRGGYYLDTKINGEGCAYKTGAHSRAYHDYSTGFRCCADPLGSAD
jgi:formylglycine-generating enzyme required for sulfatase activity